MRIILASASPRRRELLSQLGVEFEVCPSQGEEKITEHLPELAVMQLAQQKAADIAGKTEGDAWILGADTIVVYDQKILGKPKDEEDAKRMLGMLQNHRHQVYTGVCIWKKENGSEEIRCFYEKTDVVFYPMTEEEIAKYVATGEPMDKAGSYGIQGIGGLYVREIHGDYNNVWWDCQLHVCIMNYRNNGEAILASVVAGKSDKWYIKNNAVDILKLK
ncbi:MAG: Maf family protein [Eubacterium sp.]